MECVRSSVRESKLCLQGVTRDVRSNNFVSCVPTFHIHNTGCVPAGSGVRVPQGGSCDRAWTVELGDARGLSDSREVLASWEVAS